MTFCPEWLTGSPNLDTSNVLNFWVYLVVRAASTQLLSFHQAEMFPVLVYEHYLGPCSTLADAGLLPRTCRVVAFNF